MGTELNKEDFDKLLEEFDDNFQWPKYSADGKLVMVTHKDKDGYRWVMITGSETFHNAMVDASKNYKYEE